MTKVFNFSCLVHQNRNKKVTLNRNSAAICQFQDHNRQELTFHSRLTKIAAIMSKKVKLQECSKDKVYN